MSPTVVKDKVTKSTPDSDIAVARVQARLDRETLTNGDNKFREQGYLMNRASTRGSEQGDSGMVIGIGVNFSFGGPKKPEFNASLIGDVGTAVEAIKVISIEGSRTNKVIRALDPAEHLNRAGEKIGLEHNPNMETRHASEIAHDEALKRTGAYNKWSDAARKAGYSGFNKSDSEAENATRFVMSLLDQEKILSNFKISHRVSADDMKVLKTKILNAVLSFEPNQEGGITAGFKKLFGHQPDSGFLENGRLSEDSKESIKGWLKDDYKELQASRKK